MTAGFWHDEDGLIHVEHAILLALLVVGAILVWTLFGGKLRSVISSSNDAFAKAAGVTSTAGDPAGIGPRKAY